MCVRLSVGVGVDVCVWCVNVFFTSFFASSSFSVSFLFYFSYSFLSSFSSSVSSVSFFFFCFVVVVVTVVAVVAHFWFSLFIFSWCCMFVFSLALHLVVSLVFFISFALSKSFARSLCRNTRLCALIVLHRCRHILVSVSLRVALCLVNTDHVSQCISRSFHLCAKINVHVPSCTK